MALGLRKELLTSGRNKFEGDQDDRVQKMLGNVGMMLVQDIITA